MRIVGGPRQGELQAQIWLQAAGPGEPADGLGPSERLLDRLAFLLADRIARLSHGRRQSPRLGWYSRVRVASHSTRADRRQTHAHRTLERLQQQRSQQPLGRNRCRSSRRSSRTPHRARSTSLTTRRINRSGCFVGTILQVNVGEQLTRPRIPTSHPRLLRWEGNHSRPPLSAGEHSPQSRGYHSSATFWEAAQLSKVAPDRDRFSVPGCSELKQVLTGREIT